MHEIAYIALGSNLRQPRRQLDRAVQALRGLPRSRDFIVSSYYRSVPVGPRKQADFLNAVACVSTAVPPLELLKLLQKQERRQGRVRHRRWGARTLDLDLLLYGKRRIHTRGLIVPHPRMTQRAFVLNPMMEIAPHDLLIPGKGSLQELASRLPTRQ